MGMCGHGGKMAGERGGLQVGVCVRGDGVRGEGQQPVREIVRVRVLREIRVVVVDFAHFEGRGPIKFLRRARWHHRQHG